MCDATQPETALHLNTKYHIYRQLLLGSILYVEQLCSDGCGRARVVLWASGWQGVKVESQVGLPRPDIVIVCDGMLGPERGFCGSEQKIGV